MPTGRVTTTAAAAAAAAEKVGLACNYVDGRWVACWRNGAGRRTCDQGGREFDPRPGADACDDTTTTLGKLFTPMCLEADIRHYHVESLNQLVYR